MDAHQAVEYGMVDRVISRRELHGSAPPLNGTHPNGSAR
jgi:hypothetical protein